MVKHVIDLKTPRTPTFILTNRDDVKFHISQLSEDQLNRLAEEWKTDLIARSKKPYTGTPSKRQAI